MYKKHIILPVLLASVLLIISCRPSTDSRPGVSDGINIVVSDFGKNDPIALSAYVDTFRVVPLETNSNCLLGELSKIKVTHDGIFIQDNNRLGRSQHIYRFDSNGRFLNVVGRLGQGPEECIDIESFAVDDRQGLVYIHSRANECLMVYRADGSFVRRIPMDYRADAIEYVDNKIYLGGGNGSRNLYKLIAVDPETGRVLEEYNPSRKYYASNPPCLQACQDELYYYPNEDRDTVYQVVNHETLDVAFRLDWGEHTLPDAVWEKSNNWKNGPMQGEEAMEYNRLLQTKQYIPGIDDFAVFNRLFYFRFACGAVSNGFYNRETGETVTSTDLRNDVSYLGFNFIGQTDTELISLYDGNGIDDDIERMQTEHWQKYTGTSAEKVAEVVERLKKLKAQVGEDPNPVLVFYKVK